MRKNITLDFVFLVIAFCNCSLLIFVRSISQIDWSSSVQCTRTITLAVIILVIACCSFLSGAYLGDYTRCQLET